MKSIATLAAYLLLITGCGYDGRIVKLEKQATEMQSERDRVAEFDLQSRCATDARQWFKENWLPSDKATTVLDFRSHYNKKKNKCFILVERHYNSHFAGPGGESWTNY